MFAFFIKLSYPQEAGLCLSSHINSPRKLHLRMPLHLEMDIAGQGRLSIWKVDEDISSVSESFLPKISRTKSLKRQLELIGEYHLAKQLGVLGKIQYLQNGKPVLEEGHITISHDQHFVGFYISEIPVGMDIQRPTEQLKRIQHKFCNARELNMLADTDNRLRDLTYIWSAKEAIFKIYGENVPFAEGMHIEIGEDRLLCTMRDGVEHELKFFDLEGSTVVYNVS